MVVTSQIGATWLAGGGVHPQLARDDGALAGLESALGGRRIPGSRATEVFFERPQALADEYPALHALLAGYYGVDPRHWN